MLSPIGQLTGYITFANAGSLIGKLSPYSLNLVGTLTIESGGDSLYWGDF